MFCKESLFCVLEWMGRGYDEVEDGSTRFEMVFGPCESGIEEWRLVLDSDEMGEWDE